MNLHWDINDKRLVYLWQGCFRLNGVFLETLALCYCNVSFKGNFIYLWLCWVFTASWAFLQLCLVGATIQLSHRASHCRDLTWSRAWALGCTGSVLVHTRSAVVAPELQSTGSTAWHMRIAALRHLGSSWTSDRTHVSAVADRFFTTDAPGKPSQSMPHQ